MEAVRPTRNKIVSDAKSVLERLADEFEQEAELLTDAHGGYSGWQPVQISLRRLAAKLREVAEGE